MGVLHAGLQKVHIALSPLVGPAGRVREAPGGRRFREERLRRARQAVHVPQLRGAEA